MKAVVQVGYGSADVIELREIDRPVAQDGEVLVRVQAASLAAGDYFAMRGTPLPVRLAIGFPRPKKDHVVGLDVAGRVEAVGGNVTRFRQGDEVFGEARGACAEYACADEGKLALKPRNLTFEQAAAVPTSALAALHGLRDHGKVRPGQKVLINGASGGVGTFAVQIARVLGADVTGVCSTGNVDTVRSIGADHVIDYTKEDFTKGDERYDLILDNIASHAFADYRHVLAPGGMLIPNSGHAGMGYVFEAFLLPLVMRQQQRPFVSTPNHADLIALKELVEAGRVTPVVDRRYPLSETAEAFRYLDEGHARGKVVIVVADGDPGSVQDSSPGPSCRRRPARARGHRHPSVHRPCRRTRSIQASTRSGSTNRSRVPPITTPARNARTSSSPFTGPRPRS
jgi:NADPH:quinone reductase-like Zn-dependent oxidoreductase